MRKKLTSTRNLLGRAGGRFLLFGMLTRSPEGRLCLEDLDGTVPLDISQTVWFLLFDYVPHLPDSYA